MNKHSSKYVISVKRKLLNFSRQQLVYITNLPRLLWFRILSAFTRVSSRSSCKFPTFFNGAGKIEIGHRVVIGVINSPYFLSGYNYLEARSTEAEILIHDGVQINNNFVCIADQTKVCIGENTLIGFNVQIYDSNFHDLDPNKRLNLDPNPKPVIIGKNVFVGSNVTILKGVCIGDNSVIGSGSVVSNSIPSNSLASGNPAKIIERS